MAGDSIEIPIDVGGDFEAAIGSAESAVSSLESALGSVADASDDASAALGDVADEAKDAGKLGDKSLSKLENAAGDVEDSAQDAADAMGDIGDQAQSGADTGSIAIGSFIGGALESLSTKALEIGKELAKAFGAFVLETERGDRAAKGLLATIAGSAGEADALFGGMQKLAKGLGGDVNDITQDFVDFQTKGLSQVDSVALVKLKADIEAIAPETGLAEKATEEFLGRIESGEKAADVLGEIADKYRVAGDGSNAAAASAFTLEGMIQSLKNTLRELVGDALQELGPTLQEVGGDLRSFLKDASESGDIKEFAKGMVTAAKGAIAFGKAVYDVGVAFADVAGPALDELGDALEELDAAFGGAGDGGQVLAAIGTVLGNSFKATIEGTTLLVNAITFLANAFGKIGAAGKVVIDEVSSWPGAIGETVDGWVSAAGDLVDGFIKGIEEKIGEVVDKAKAMGDAAAGALKDALGIASPSKVAEGLADNFGGTFSDTLEDHAVDPTSIVTDVSDVPVANDNQMMPASSGGIVFQEGAIVIQITADGQDGAALADQIYDRLMERAQGAAESRGAA